MSQIKKPWRSLEEFAAHSSPSPKKAKTIAVNSPTKITAPDALSRRGFFKTMGAATALLGVSGCTAIRRPVREILPYSQRPEHLVPGNPLFYATAYSLGEEVYGVLAESHQGRPTKLAGNPLYPANQGSANTFMQAAILNLYDPERFSSVLKGGREVEKKAIERWISALALQSNQGAGTGILFTQEVSLVFHRLLSAVKKQYPALELYRYEPVNNDKVYQGVSAISKKRVRPVVDFKRAEVVVSLGSDFLGLAPGGLAAARDFMGRRKPEEDKFNRLYQFENTFSLTGGIADHRFRIKKSDLEIIAYSLLTGLQRSGIKKINRFFTSKLEKALFSSLPYLKELPAYQALPAVLSDLLAHQGRCAVVADASLSPLMHGIVFYLNEILGNNGSVIRYYEANFSKEPVLETVLSESSGAAIARLAEDVKSGRLKNLLVLGGDPVYTAPANLDFATLYKSLNTLSLSFLPTETAASSKLVVPQKHFLETWSDAVSLEGAAAPVQPLLRPLKAAALSSVELLAQLLGEKKDDYTLTQEQLGVSKAKWQRALHNGVLSEAVRASQNVRTQRLEAFANEQNNKIYSSDEAMEVAFEPDYSVYDGRFINNAWLQEMPDPITKLTWDNAVLISHRTAKRLQVKPYDLVRVSVGGRSVEGAIWIVPGQADESLTLRLGYGQKTTGQVGAGSGFSAYKLRVERDGELVGWLKGVEAAKTGATYRLASVQDHWKVEDEIFQGRPSSNSQNGRPLFRQASLSEYKKHPDFARELEEVPALEPHNDKYLESKKRPAMFADHLSIFPERTYEQGYQWGMSIDLSTCTGCNACLVACQAENNIPTVGKEMVLESREMHWIRLDRYFEGNPEAPTMVHQPVTCLQCESAPCEQVCPVAATVHSEEGLNDMVYNRCVGTRFCSNNCPVKVRRFNYFDYHATAPTAKKRVSPHLFALFREAAETVSLQFNPDVTVRMRGVMEKCTYCIQRISRTRIAAKNEKRSIQDGEIVPACQETCPTGSIVFGDVNDKNSRVAKEKAKPRNYHLLASLNLKPRTTYLAAVNNPNEKLKV